MPYALRTRFDLCFSHFISAIRLCAEIDATTQSHQQDILEWNLRTKDAEIAPVVRAATPRSLFIRRIQLSPLLIPIPHTLHSPIVMSRSRRLSGPTNDIQERGEEKRQKCVLPFFPHD